MMIKKFGIYFSAVTLFIFGVSAFAEGKTYDAQFLDKMTEHHRQGIEMAKLAKDRAANAELKKMSDKMIKDQTKEISQMEKWRKGDFPKEPQATNIPPKMDMEPLKSASGESFDHHFIDMMSKHHDDGIELAKDAESKASTGKVRTFAKGIVRNQSMEKENMSKLHAPSH